MFKFSEVIDVSNAYTSLQHKNNFSLCCSNFKFSNAGHSVLLFFPFFCLSCVRLKLTHLSCKPTHRERDEETEIEKFEHEIESNEHKNIMNYIFAWQSHHVTHESRTKLLSFQLISNRMLRSFSIKAAHACIIQFFFWLLATICVLKNVHCVCAHVCILFLSENRLN